MVQPPLPPTHRSAAALPAPPWPEQARPGQPPPVWAMLDPPRRRQLAQLMAELLRRRWRQRDATEGRDDQHAERS
jgi:hypothetical protein